MPAVPANAKKPTDRKPKADDEAKVFTFTHNDTEYAFRDVYEVMTPGFLRKNRRRDEMDQFWTLVEALADEDTLEVIDNMSRDEFADLFRDFTEFVGSTPGE